MPKNTLSLDFRDNPELKAALGGKQPGDKITVEFDLMVKDVTDEGLDASIECVYCDNDEGDPAEAAVSADEPVMVVMRAAKAKSAAKPASKEDDADET